MAVRIRLTRFGKKNTPIFRIVAVDGRKKRDGAYLENLGTYNPVTGSLEQFHEDRINYWISKGAIETDTVKKLHKQHKKTAQPASAE